MSRFSRIQPNLLRHSNSRSASNVSHRSKKVNTTGHTHRDEQAERKYRHTLSVCSRVLICFVLCVVCSIVPSPPDSIPRVIHPHTPHSRHSELEWKLVYVGSAEDDQYDQELDSVLVGPIIVGKNKFVFEANAPDPTLIPAKDIMEVTVLLLTCAYKEKEFIRIGYYVVNDYDSSEVDLLTSRDAWLAQVAQLHRDYADAVNEVKAREEEMRAAGQLMEGSLPLPPQPVIPPPPAVDITKLTRNILADKPRVTRFQIPWDEVDASQEVRHTTSDTHSRMSTPPRSCLLHLP